MKSPVHMESPVGTVRVHPRRKAGHAKLGRGTQAVHLTRSDLVSMSMHLRLREASEQLGLSTTTVKKACRTLGIYKWNTTSIGECCDDGSDDENHGNSLESVPSSAESQSVFDNKRAVAWPAHSPTSEQASCMALGSGVTSGSTTSTAAAQERADEATLSRESSSSTVDSGRAAEPGEALNLQP